MSADDAAALRGACARACRCTSSRRSTHPRRRGPPYAERAGVVFVGNFRHTPNVDAAVHFVAETWPLVRAALPGVRLSLVGTAPPPAVQALAGPDVDVTGWVPETRPYLDAARVSIAPLRFGAGVKGKIAEALACGLPVVTTTIGAEGMDLVDGEHALVADAPQAFADAVVRLHRDSALWERVAARGHERLDAALSPAVAHAALRTLLADAAPRLFVAAGDLSADDALREVLAGYLGAFAEGDRVSLAVPVGDGADPDALFARLVEALGALGHDPDHIPDVALLAWPDGAALPAAAVAAPPADWYATAAVAPSAAPTPPVAVVVRLPEDAGDAEVQLAAVAAAGLPARRRAACSWPTSRVPPTSRRCWRARPSRPSPARSGSARTSAGGRRCNVPSPPPPHRSSSCSSPTRCPSPASSRRWSPRSAAAPCWPRRSSTGPTACASATTARSGPARPTPPARPTRWRSTAWPPPARRGSTCRRRCRRARAMPRCSLPRGPPPAGRSRSSPRRRCAARRRLPRRS